MKGTTKWPASVRALLVPGFRRVVEPSIDLVFLGFLFPVLHRLAMFPFGRSRRPDRDLDALKRQQIEALKQAVPTARAVNSDSSLFDLPIPSASATAVLRVSLPHNFPDEPPSLRLLGLGVRHAWIDATGAVVRHPKLSPWQSTHSLAEVCTSVMQEITKTVGGSPTVGVGVAVQWGGGGG
ncbi:hypothetical protein NGA_0436300, partial [Nannochloropsis gaditana CCMP526]|uniref:uncharacterized protein n=1 Tax=Nannochloropsis gaditana (strain CCMP526) TaxID=1093141 RepID=UPI00029F6032